MSVTEIEAAIKTLPKEELSVLDRWYREFMEDRWDEQIRQDIQAGKLASLLNEARQERANGTLRPFP